MCTFIPNIQQLKIVLTLETPTVEHTCVKLSHERQSVFENINESKIHTNFAGNHIH